MHLLVVEIFERLEILLASAREQRLVQMRFVRLTLLTQIFTLTWSLLASELTSLSFSMSLAWIWARSISHPLFIVLTLLLSSCSFTRNASTMSSNFSWWPLSICSDFSRSACSEPQKYSSAMIPVRSMRSPLSLQAIPSCLDSSLRRKRNTFRIDSSLLFISFLHSSSIFFFMLSTHPMKRSDSSLAFIPARIVKSWKCNVSSSSLRPCSFSSCPWLIRSKFQLHSSLLLSASSTSSKFMGSL